MAYMNSFAIKLPMLHCYSLFPLDFSMQHAACLNFFTRGWAASDVNAIIAFDGQMVRVVCSRPAEGGLLVLMNTLNNQFMH